jgi:hypothetical protein
VKIFRLWLRYERGQPPDSAFQHAAMFTLSSAPSTHRKVICLRCAAICAVLAVACLRLSAVEFRSIDGSDNNPFLPMQGAANTRVIRFGYPADYPDGIGDVITESRKPNPRDISNIVNAQSASIVNARGLSDWAVQWGQFVTHDVSLIPTSVTSNTSHTGVVGDFNIAITDPSDPLWPQPIAFNRSVFDPATGNGDTMLSTHGRIPIPRSQINANTSYIDASHIYGSNSITAASLRTMSDGKMATSAGGLLPGTTASGQIIAGDERANENVSLSATHALFVREHNRLAELIKSQDSALGDEEIYQWARKIVGAEIQAITYREFLPAIMGSSAPSAAEYVYDEGTDASVTTAFTAGAFRFGHSMQSPQHSLVANSGVQVGAISLGVSGAPNSILRDDPGTVELLLKGMATQAAQENDVYVVDELRNVRFGPPGAGGTDLAAVDIQRGRDIGLLNSYNKLRIAYSLPPVNTFSQLTSDPAVQAALSAAYGTVDNVDAWISMIAEDHLPGSSLGRLAQLIITSQFTRLRDGDRFFYTGDPDLQTDLVTSIIDLDSITLSQLIELNTGVSDLQDNVFFVAAPVPEPSTSALLLVCGCVVCLFLRV